MLTSDLAMSWRRGHRIGPRALDASNELLVASAGDLVDIVTEHVGRPRSELERAFEEYIGTGTDYRIIRGLIKLLTDRCEFATASPVEPAALRREVFLRAREAHPVVSNLEARDRVLAAAADALGVRLDGLDGWLYADLTANERLVDFQPLEARDLIEHYNLAQAQALLYRCTRLILRVDPQPALEYRRLFDAIKAYRLIYALQGTAATGYQLALDGPVSIFHRSQKYGVKMAVFLPALLECSGWRLEAEIDVKPYGSALYELDSATTRLRAPEPSLTSGRHPVVEKILAGLLKTGEGWSAEPSNEVVDLGKSAFVPDAVARHEDGTVVYIEVLGFWTPKYLSTRLAELSAAGDVRFLLVASSELLASRDGYEAEESNVVVFKTSLDLKALRTALERIRCSAGGDLT